MALLLLAAVGYGAADGWFVGLFDGRTSSTEQSAQDSLLAETSNEGITDEEAQGEPDDSASTGTVAGVDSIGPDEPPESLQALPAATDETVQEVAPLSADELRNLPKALRDALRNPTAVGTLVLSSLGLTTFPESISRLTNLQWLDLRLNPIAQTEREKIRRLLPNTEIKF